MTASALVQDLGVLTGARLRPVLPVRTQGGLDVPRELWRELGQAMRSVRVTQGYSLRQVEALTGWGRGSLSQAENGKARPSRSMVEWYEVTFKADGLLMSLYSEARVAHRIVGPQPGAEAGRPLDGDEHLVERAFVPTGVLVVPGEPIDGGWTLRNSGGVPWRGRQLLRLGAYAGPRLIGSPRVVPVPDAEPGQSVSVAVPLVAPVMPCTAVAYWRMVDGEGRYCLPMSEALSVLIVVVGPN